MKKEILKHSSKERNDINPHLIIIMGLLLSSIIFMFDLLTPLGVADGMCYIGVVLLSILTNEKKSTVIISVSSAIFIIAGFLFSPSVLDPSESYISITNRSLSITIVAFSSIVLIRNKDLKNIVKAKTEKLAITNQELDSFNFITSHDLQEPLRKIKNFATILLDKEEQNLTGKGKYYLQRLVATVQQMQMFLDSLLAYSRINHPDHPPEEIELNKLFNEILLNFNEIIKEKNGTIKIEGSCKSKIIRAQFKELMSQLIANSIKFSHPDRGVNIIIRNEMVSGNKSINQALLPKIKYCRTSIVDNGIGFDPQYKERIFGIFQRLHAYEQYKGSGIGLAICKKIAENHQGVILAKGELNKGAQFDIYIPIQGKI